MDENIVLSREIKTIRESDGNAKFTGWGQQQNGNDQG